MGIPMLITLVSGGAHYKIGEWLNVVSAAASVNSKAGLCFYLNLGTDSLALHKAHQIVNLHKMGMINIKLSMILSYVSLTDSFTTFHVSQKSSFPFKINSKCKLRLNKYSQSENLIIQNLYKNVSLLKKHIFSL